MNGSRPQAKAKSFDIPKRMVWEAYQRVRANKGAPGVDGVTIEQFEQDLKGNLYKLWVVTPFNDMIKDFMESSSE